MKTSVDYLKSESKWNTATIAQRKRWLSKAGHSINHAHRAFEFVQHQAKIDVMYVHRTEESKEAEQNDYPSGNCPSCGCD